MLEPHRDRAVKQPRERLTIGSVLEVRVDDRSTRFFQAIAIDMAQLNSHVIRVFDERYRIDEPVDIPRIVAGRPAFHAHVFLGLGSKLGFRRKVGSAPGPHAVDVLFRNSYDYGNPSIVLSKNWYVWRINEVPRPVGELRGEFQTADIGVVVSPDSLVHRIRHGRYDFVYPGY